MLPADALRVVERVLVGLGDPKALNPQPLNPKPSNPQTLTLTPRVCKGQGRVLCSTLGLWGLNFKA